MNTPSLYQKLLGASWSDLAADVQAMHAAGGLKANGRFEITHGANLAARLLAKLARLPAAGADVPVTLEVIAQAEGAEVWQRNFGGKPLVTQQTAWAGGLVESFGLLWLLFDLRVADGALHYRQNRAWLSLGSVRVPVPRWCAPCIAAREWATTTGTQVIVEVSLPLVGALVTYRGAILLSSK